MNDSPAPLHPHEVVAALRAAGCVFAEEEADLLRAAAGTPAELQALLHRRVQGLPLEQVLGWARFCGLQIWLEPGVFVPRHRTELLVQHAVDLARGPDAPIVLDLCCGSGALGAAVLAGLAAGRAELHAADIDPAAIRCARRNLEPIGGLVHLGDLYAPLPRRLAGRVDVLIANVPYVPTEAIALLPPEARLYEPMVALDGGPDGLDVLRRVIAEAARWLAPGGHLLFETSQRQAPQARRALARHGFGARVAGSDDDPSVAVFIAGRASG